MGEMELKKPVFRFRVLGKPQSRGSKSPWVLKDKSGQPVLSEQGKPRVIVRDDNPKSRDWMNAVREEAAKAMLLHGLELMRGNAIILACVFFFTRPKSHFRTGKNANVVRKTAPGACHAQKPDLSKLVRGLEDALSGVVYVDDSQIALLSAAKYWTVGFSRTDISVGELDVDKIWPVG